MTSTRPEGAEYYRALDGLRGFAITLVMIEHWWSYKPVVPLSGAVGVNIFFVLSGFLITEILYRSRGTHGALGRFWWRRAVRIFPVYYVYLAALFLLMRPSTGYLMPWASTYTLNLYTSITGDMAPRVVSHLWSLCIEEQFYLVWPFVILIAPERWMSKIVLLTPVIGIGVRAAILQSEIPWRNEIAYYITPAAVDALGAGAVLALLKARAPSKWRSWTSNGSRLDVLAATGLFFSSVLRYRGAEWSPLMERSLSAFVGVTLILGLLSPRAPAWLKAPFDSKALVGLGKISYGVYVYHLGVEAILAPTLQGFLDGRAYFGSKLLQYNAYLITMPLYTVATLILATASFYYLERPLLRLKDSRPTFRRQRPIAALPED